MINGASVRVNWRTMRRCVSQINMVELGFKNYLITFGFGHVY